MELPLRSMVLRRFSGYESCINNMKLVWSECELHTVYPLFWIENQILTARRHGFRLAEPVAG